MTDPLIETGCEARPVLVTDVDSHTHQCVYTGDEFESTTFIKLYSPMPSAFDIIGDYETESEIREEVDTPLGPQPLKIITDETATAGVLSIAGIDGLRMALQSDADDSDDNIIAPSGRIWYDTMRGDIQYQCMVCGESPSDGTSIIVFSSAYENKGIIHQDCVPRFVEALNSVWEHADNLLPENL